MQGKTDGAPGAMRRCDWKRGALAACVLVVLAIAPSGCGDDSTGPVLDREEVAGTYTLTALIFDPQGSLAAIDIHGRLGTNPQMIVAASGAVQIVYQDPVTNLFTTVQGTYRTTADGIRIDFDSGSPFASMLLSRQMQFTFNATAGTLSFDADAPDGVDRTRLLQLAPELANEQLLNPTPGRLQVTFTR